jgi:hypothetical protein
MTLFPFGTFLRLLSRARTGSPLAVACLSAFVGGIALIVVSTISNSTVGFVIGVVLFIGSLFGSKPPSGWTPGS